MANPNGSKFVGKENDLFYNLITNELRISDGHTVGGQLIINPNIIESVNKTLNSIRNPDGSIPGNYYKIKADDNWVILI